MNNNVVENWKTFNEHINTVMDKFLPSKFTNTRHNLSWLQNIENKDCRIKPTSKRMKIGNITTHKHNTKTLRSR